MKLIKRNKMKNLKVNDFTNDTKAKVQKTINQIKVIGNKKVINGPNIDFQKFLL